MESVIHFAVSYSFISPQGLVVRVKSIKDFAQEHGLHYSSAKSLACGHYQSLHGWISTHPRAKQRRERMLTEVVNLKTGERTRIGKYVTHFVEKHGLAVNDTYKLLNGKLMAYRGWVLASTFEIIKGGPEADC